MNNILLTFEYPSMLNHRKSPNRLKMYCKISASFQMLDTGVNHVCKTKVNYKIPSNS